MLTSFRRASSSVASIAAAAAASDIPLPPLLLHWRCRLAASTTVLANSSIETAVVWSIGPDAGIANLSILTAIYVISVIQSYIHTFFRTAERIFLSHSPRTAWPTASFQK